MLSCLPVWRKTAGSYEGFSIAPEGSKYEGKLVEYDDAGNEVRPDISITKSNISIAYQ